MNHKIKDDSPQDGVFPEYLIPQVNTEIDRISDMRQSIPGYAGICTCCFEPVKNGEEYRFPGSKTTFHARCVELNPNSYYIRRERRRSEKRAAK